MAEGTDDRRRAAELYEKAMALESERDYAGARRCYEESLQLHEDEDVRKAYLKLLSAIGPA